MSPQVLNAVGFYQYVLGVLRGELVCLTNGSVWGTGCRLRGGGEAAPCGRTPGNVVVSLSVLCRTRFFDVINFLRNNIFPRHVVQQSERSSGATTIRSQLSQATFCASIVVILEWRIGSLRKRRSRFPQTLPIRSFNYNNKSSTFSNVPIR